MTAGRQVNVWGKLYTITIHQRSKSVCIATGEYMGVRIEVKGSSAASAARHWQDAARYRGNL
ncbi:MAG: hypothetical protein ACRDGS_10845 [Chloroflexota bacterium]